MAEGGHHLTKAPNPQPQFQNAATKNKTLCGSPNSWVAMSIWIWMATRNIYRDYMILVDLLRPSSVYPFQCATKELQYDFIVHGKITGTKRQGARDMYRTDVKLFSPQMICFTRIMRGIDEHISRTFITPWEALILEKILCCINV